jgi:hypothetical protein
MAANQQPVDYQYWPTAAAAANDFYLHAGLYGLTLSASAWGTANLQRLLPDGATYVSVMPAVVAASGCTTYYLPSARYRLVVAGTTAFVGVLEKISAPVR